MTVKKVAFAFNPFKDSGVNVPKDRQADALEDVKNYVKEQVLSHVGEGKSPVQGGRWKRSLSKSYAKEKKGESSAGFANLELSGEMLNDLDVVEVNSQKLSLQIEGAEAPKAEGNNIGSYGRDPNPKNAREFIPKPSQKLNRSIQAGIKTILERYSKDEE